MKLNFTRSIVILFLVAFSHPAFAILNPQIDSIPMRDGKKLAADIYIPQGFTNGPVVVIQSPYNRVLYRLGLPLLVEQNLNTSNYAFVVVDWRGRFGSAAAAYPGAPGQGSDGYDVVEWVAAQSWSNGKIGTWGPSALGKVQYNTALNNPPHLVCICPLVAAPQYDYEEYYPGGSARTEYLEQLDVLQFGITPTVVAHPFRDFTWILSESSTFFPDSIRVPALMIGGWYDHTVEQMLPFYTGLQNLSLANVRSKHRLLMGPWVHGGNGSANVGSITQGELTYPLTPNYDDSVARAFFDYYLRDVQNGWDQTPPVQYYQMGENNWSNSTAWPPAGTASTNFYLHSNGLIDGAIPTSTTDTLAYNYDPTDPSPTIGGPTLRNDLEQGPYDQVAAVESRNDILIFTTPTLTSNVEMKGQAVVHLKVSSNRKDTDFAIRLTDVYPDGRSMLVNHSIQRMRFRNGYAVADTASMIPGTVYNCDIELPNTAITFMAGHKIRIDVSSSNYPAFNRNANTGGVMYPGNSLDSLQNPLIAHNTVHTNSLRASYITLPLVNFNSITETTTPATDMKLYPNPVTNLLNIEVNNNCPQRVEVLNTLGQKVFETTLLGRGTIDFSDYQPGIYLVGSKGAYQKVVR